MAGTKQIQYRLNREVLDDAKAELGISYKEMHKEMVHILGSKAVSERTITDAFNKASAKLNTVNALAAVLNLDKESFVVDAEIPPERQQLNTVKSVPASHTIPWQWMSVTLLCIVVLAAIAILKPWDKQIVDDNMVFVEPPKKVFNKYRLVLINESGPSAIFDRLSTAFDDKPLYNIIAQAAPADETISFSKAKSTWNPSALILFNVHKGDVFDALTVRWVTDTQDIIVYSDFFHPATVDSQDSLRAKEIAYKIKVLVDQIVESEIFPVQSNLQRFKLLVLNGMDALFFASLEEDYQQVLDFLILADEINPDSVVTKGLLCETYAKMYWTADIQTLLEKAQKACAEAKALDEESLFYIIGNSYFGLYTDNVDAVSEQIENALQKYPQSSPLLTVASRIYARSPADKQGAIALARQAISSEKRNWQAYNEIGLLHFRAGEIEQAAEAFEGAFNIVKKPVVASNLGTIKFCLGEFQDAKVAYQQIIQSADKNTSEHLGYEHLGNVYYFLGDYDLALNNYLAALRGREDIQIPQLWGQLGFIYLKLGNKSDALQAFENALSISQKDQMRETSNVGVRLFVLFYQVNVILVNSSQPNVELYRPIYDQLLTYDHSFSLNQRHALAFLAGVFGQPDEKQRIWDRLAEICPSYRQSPILINN